MTEEQIDPKKITLSSSSTQKELSVKEHHCVSICIQYEWVCKKIEHENNLIASRLGWLMQSQGFFAVAFGVILNKDNYVNEKQFYLACIAFSGVAISLLVLLSVINASNSIRKLQCWWYNIALREHDGNNPAPPLIGWAKSVIDSRMASFGIPIIIALLWILITIKIVS